MVQLADIFANDGGASGGGSICYGDLITLHVSQQDGFVAAEGVLDNECEVRVLPNSFEDCVFRVCIRNRVSAVRELVDYQDAKRKALAAERAGIDSAPEGNSSIVHREVSRDPATNEVLDDEDDTYLHTLRRVAANEGALNESLSRERNGTPVKFGDTMQLMHVRSSKFITANTETVAELERENLRVSLDENGTALSWLTVEPISAIDSPGDRLPNLCDCLLSMQERPGEHLHCSAAALPRPSRVPRAGVHATSRQVSSPHSRANFPLLLQPTCRNCPCRLRCLPARLLAHASFASILSLHVFNFFSTTRSAAHRLTDPAVTSGARAELLTRPHLMEASDLQPLYAAG